MYLIDYHLHTNHSMDSEMPMQVLCEASVRAGLSEICLTEHTEFGHPDPNSDKPPDVEAWLAEIEEMRIRFPMLKIRAGIEIGDNPACRDRIKAWHTALPLDFMLLSLHLIDNEDPYFPSFFEGKDQETFYRRYVESKLESLRAWEPSEYDAMAHLGFCAKFAPYPAKDRPLRYAHAPDALDEIFTILAQNGKALEINTSGRKTMDSFLPSRELVERFVMLGGEFVTLGSDAHEPAYVGKWIPDAWAMAKDCGVRYALTFAGRKPVPVRL